MFDLNRQLINEDKNIVSLTKRNLEKFTGEIKESTMLHGNAPLDLFSQ
jgi:hypothetical protein